MPVREDAALTAEELEAERLVEQEAVDEAEPLTAEEEAEKVELTAEGFPTWTKREYQAFIRGTEQLGRCVIRVCWVAWDVELTCDLGRDSFELIQIKEIPTKTVDEIRDYAAVFWERYTEIEDHERQIKKIEDAEAGRARDDRLSALVKKKVSSVAYPLQSLKITYANQTKGKSYSDEEDRYLLCELAKYGVGKIDTPDKIKADINASPLFLFDWFLKSVSSRSRRLNLAEPHR